MLITIYALLLAGVLLLPILLLYFVDKKQKRLEKEKFCQHLAQAAQLHQLSFTSQEEVGNLVFGLDGLKRKMAVVEKRSAVTYSIRLIDLNEIRSCVVNKQCVTFPDTDFGGARVATEPSVITLTIYLNNQPPFEMVFYSDEDNQRRNAALLERKARHWEQLLLKMVSPVERRA